MIDLDALEQQGMPDVTDPRWEALPVQIERGHLLALTRAVRAAASVSQTAPWTWAAGEPGFNEVAFETALEELDAALAPFRKEPA